MSYRDILQKFRRELPSVRAAVFCDAEGETIESSSDFDTYHTQLVAAYQSEMNMIAERSMRQLTLDVECVQWRATGGVVSVWPLGGGYYVAALSRDGLAFHHPSVRALVRELKNEL